MNVLELSEKLIAAGADQRCYSLDGSSPVLEGFVLDRSAGAWKISYFERGTWRTIRLCGTEAEACDFFYSQVVCY